jgi:hypothetical protein
MMKAAAPRRRAVRKEARVEETVRLTRYSHGAG